MSQQIEKYLRDRLAVVRALAEGRDLPVSVIRIAKAEDALAREYGEDVFNQIHRRSIQMVGELLGGEPAPALAQLNLDGVVAVECDIAAEQIVKEARRSGVAPSRDPNWRDNVNARWADQVREVRQKAADMVRAVKQKAKPAAVSQPIESLVKAEVSRQLSERSATVNGDASIYLGVWKDNATYSRGNEVTHKGLLWHCWQDGTSDKPGTNDRWQMKLKDEQKKGAA